MKTNILRLSIPLGVLSLVLFAFAALVLRPVAANAEEMMKPRTVVVALSSTPDYTDVADVKWEQILAEKGITLDKKYFEGSPPAHRAVVAGAADVSSAEIVPVARMAREAGGVLKTFVNILRTTDYVLVSQPDVKSLSGLTGKGVGISGPGALSDTLTRAVLQAENIDSDAVKFVQIGGTSARIKALLAGQIAAGPAHFADALDAADEGDLKLLWNYGKSVPQFVQHGLSARPEWLKENPKLAQTLVDAMIDALRWADQNKQAYVELSKQDVEGISDEVRRKTYDKFKEVNLFAVNGAIEKADVDGTVSVAKKVGALGGNVPAYADWVDPSFVNDYLERKGRL